MGDIIRALPVPERRRTGPGGDAIPSREGSAIGPSSGSGEYGIPRRPMERPHRSRLETSRGRTGARMTAGERQFRLAVIAPHGRHDVCHLRQPSAPLSYRKQLSHSSRSVMAPGHAGRPARAVRGGAECPGARLGRATVTDVSRSSTFMSSRSPARRSTIGCAFSRCIRYTLSPGQPHERLYDVTWLAPFGWRRGPSDRTSQRARSSLPTRSARSARVSAQSVPVTDPAPGALPGPAPQRGVGSPGGPAPQAPRPST